MPNHLLTNNRPYRFCIFTKLPCFYVCSISPSSLSVKPVFHLATLFAPREAKTRIRHCDWLELAGEKIRRKQVGTVPTFFSVRANKIVKWKTGFKLNKLRTRFEQPVQLTGILCFPMRFNENNIIAIYFHKYLGTKLLQNTTKNVYKQL